MLISRRRLLQLGGSVALVSMMPLKAFSSYKRPLIKKLWLYNTHTGEMFKQNYWENGQYSSSALEEVNFLLRDHRSNEVKDIQLSLLELLFQVQQLLGYQKPFDVISGYRSLRTNRQLRGMGRQVAKNSYHVRGMAIDVCFRGLSLARARKAALFLKKGGVGYYPSSGFLHMDVRGQSRYWQGT